MIRYQDELGHWQIVHDAYTLPTANEFIIDMDMYRHDDNDISRITHIKPMSYYLVLLHPDVGVVKTQEFKTIYDMMKAISTLPNIPGMFHTWAVWTTFIARTPTKYILIHLEIEMI